MKHLLVSKLIKKLDTVFSEFIRLRDADSNGICRCISCKEPHHWKECDCGHWQKRQNKGTRYNEKNCQAQCRTCNWLKQGNDTEFEKALIEKYGPTEVVLLKLRSSVKWTAFELEYMIKDYSERVKKLKAEKGL